MGTFLAKKLVCESLSLPTIPEVVARINTLVDDPDVGTREIGELVGRDAPLTTKVLRIANSALYRRRERILSIEHATAVLGVRILRNIAMQASVIDSFQHLAGQQDFDINDMWRHAILTGQACSVLASRCRARMPLEPEEFYVVGLLHDIGKVVLLEHMQGTYLDALRTSRRERTPQHICEERILGFNHTDVGAMVATRWGLPIEAAAAIQFHHGPREEVERDPVVCLVANVNLLAHRVADGNLESAATVADPPFLRLLGLRQADVEEVVAEAEQLLGQIEV